VRGPVSFAGLNDTAGLKSGHNRAGNAVTDGGKGCKMNAYYQTKTIKVKIKCPEVVKENTRDPASAVNIIRGIFSDLDADQEHFVILALNKANQINGFKVVHSGGLSQSLVDPATVFRFALLFGASAIIAVHNHPSGRTEPSQEDRAITNKLTECGKILGVILLDHIIVASGGHFSFREAGIL